MLARNRAARKRVFVSLGCRTGSLCFARFHMSWARRLRILGPDRECLWVVERREGEREGGGGGGGWGILGSFKILM